MRRALVRDLEEHGVEVVAEADERAARRRLGLGRRLEPEDVVELARELRASAVVQGRIRHRRRLWRVSIRVLDASDGRSLGTAGWRGRTARALSAVGSTGYARLRRYLRTARPAAPPPSRGGGGGSVAGAVGGGGGGGAW